MPDGRQREGTSSVGLTRPNAPWNDAHLIRFAVLLWIMLRPRCPMAGHLFLGICTTSRLDGSRHLHTSNQDIGLAALYSVTSFDHSCVLRGFSMVCFLLQKRRASSCRTEFGLRLRGAR